MSDMPLVLDADALNIIAASPERFALVGNDGPAPRILTPHHAEAARLLGVSTQDIAAKRTDAVRRLSDESGAIAVLKGFGTLVAAPGDAKPAICLAGNPGMATGGSGDVLTGMIVSLLGQGLAPLQAVRAGVLLHAMAGDCAAARFGERALIARDIIDGIPEAFRACGV